MPSLSYIAQSALLPGGIIMVGLVLNVLLGLATGRIPSDPPFRPKAQSLLSLALIIFLLGGLWGVFMQEELFRSFLLVLAGLTLFVIPYFIGIAVFASIAWLSGRKMGRGFGLVLVTGAACAGSLIFSGIVGGQINAWKIAAVRGYVARALPVLDEIQAQKGSYPTTLPVSLLGEPPELLKNYGDYSSNGSSFQFEYLDEPAGWAGGRDLYQFDDSTRKWENP
jgi:hypothetical protein